MLPQSKPNHINPNHTEPSLSLDPDETFTGFCFKQAKTNWIFMKLSKNLLAEYHLKSNKNNSEFSLKQPKPVES